MPQIVIGAGKGVFIVDDEDFDLVNQYEWKDAYDGYAQAIINGTMLSMHRLILNDPPGFLVDHINGLVNDNRKCNLRLVTHSQNQMNKRKAIGKSCRYKGVSRRGNGNYEVSIRKDGNYIYLGKFTDKIAAANCYNHYARSMFGAYAKLNDIESMEKDVWEGYKETRDNSSVYKGVH